MAMRVARSFSRGCWCDFVIISRWPPEEAEKAANTNRIYAFGVPAKMSRVFDSRKPPTADEIADLADRGADISRYLTGKGKMMPPVLPEKRTPAAGYMRYDIFGE
jgi:hypothetical protein